MEFLPPDFLQKAFMYLSAVVTIATAILTVWPSDKAEGILEIFRKILSFLSGNIGNNK